MYFNSERHHLALRPTCVVCHSAVTPNETARARMYPNPDDHHSQGFTNTLQVLSNADSTVYDGLTKSFLFPPFGIQPPAQDYILCRKPGCSICARSPEAFTVHSDCLRLFYRRCGSLPRLWTLAAWRNPWQAAASIGFCSPSSPLSLNRLFQEVTELEMPRIYKLPPEIIEIIRAFSNDSLFWRCVAVLCMIDHIAASQPQKIHNQMISQSYRWERGSQVQHANQMLPIIRLGIDSRGIKKLERFARHSHLNANSEGCSAYIVERTKRFFEVLLQNSR